MDTAYLLRGTRDVSDGERGSAWVERVRWLRDELTEAHRHDRRRATARLRNQPKPNPPPHAVPVARIRCLYPLCYNLAPRASLLSRSLKDHRVLTPTPILVPASLSHHCVSRTEPSDPVIGTCRPRAPIKSVTSTFFY